MIPRRNSLSVTNPKYPTSWSPSISSTLASATLGREPEEWIRQWNEVYAKDLVDSRIVAVDAATSVDSACNLLLTENVPCLAIKPLPNSSDNLPYSGLFDFSDVNAFLTLAATHHTIPAHELKANSRADQISSAACSGHVPVHLVSNLSEKNPLKTIAHDATLISLLAIFALGTHRVLVQSPSPSPDFLGIVSDRGLLSWFSSYAERTPTFRSYLDNSVHALSLPSLHIYTSVVATTTSAHVLDAMRLMSEEGVSSIAVIDEELGKLLSAVTVTDIGKIVVPSESNQILSTPLHQFIAQIKAPDGSTDGADKYPIYLVFPTTKLSFAIQKLLATNSHRLFVTDDDYLSPHPMLGTGNLCGIVSIVDILSLFAKNANIPDVDPTRSMRLRRTSSASLSSQSSRSDLSRRSSIVRLSASPRMVATAGDNLPSFDTLPWRKSE